MLCFREIGIFLPPPLAKGEHREPALANTGQTSKRPHRHYGITQGNTIMTEQTNDTNADVQGQTDQTAATVKSEAVQTATNEQATPPVDKPESDAPKAEVQADKKLPPPQAPKPVSRNNPFNLIITESLEDVKKIAKQFDLTDVRLLADVEKKERIHVEGIKRGEALDRFLAKHDQTITLAILLEPIWIEALLTHSSMASSVWRSIESKLFGYRTADQRNLVVVARQAGRPGSGKLVKYSKGETIPTTWRPEHKRPEGKKPEAKVQVDNKGKNGGKKVEAKQSVPQVQNASQYGLVGNPGAPIGPGGKATTPKSTKASPQLQREVRDHNAKKLMRDHGRVLRGPRLGGNGTPLLADLYLLCKGSFGPITSTDVLIPKARRIIQFHTGATMEFEDEIVKQLFAALIAYSPRSYWGGFHVLQDLVNTVGRGPAEVALMLAGYITKIPVRDQDGNEIEQPTLTEGLSGMVVNGGYGLRPDRFAGGQDALEAPQQ